MIAECDACGTSAEVEYVDVGQGDEVEGAVLLCEACEEADVPITAEVWRRAEDREGARYWYLED